MVLLHHEDGGGGDPVVLIHGFSGDATDWDYTVAHLIHRYRTIAIEMRGHGRSPAPSEPGGYTIEQMADDAWETLATLRPPPFHLVGHSMGGGVAQVMALARPGPVRSLTLVDSIAEARPPDAMAFFDEAAVIVRQRGMAGLVEWSAANFDPPDRPLPPGELERGRRRLAEMAPEGYLGSARALQRWPAVTDRLGELRMPTLIVVGEHDSEAMQRDSAVLAARIGHAGLAQIPRSGHTPHREQPEAFNAALAEFLRQVGDESTDAAH